MRFVSSKTWSVVITVNFAEFNFILKKRNEQNKVTKKKQEEVRSQAGALFTYNYLIE